jgi:hypothetical protein
VLAFTSCGPVVYEAPNASAASAAHSLIAIVPPVVTIQGRKKDDPEQLKSAAYADSYVFQDELYSWMLRRKRQGRIVGVEIMAPEVVNAKLAKAGYTLDSRILTPGEMADILGVDAVITSRFNTVKPMSEGVALALGILLDSWGTTHRTSVQLDLFDADETMLWNYDWSNSGTFTSPEQLVNGMMRNASRRMPYATK